MSFPAPPTMRRKSAEPSLKDATLEATRILTWSTQQRLSILTRRPNILTPTLKMLTATTGERDDDTKKLLNSIIGIVGDSTEGRGQPVSKRVTGIPEIMLDPINESTDLCDAFMDMLANSTSSLMEFVKDNETIPKSSTGKDSSRKTNTVLSRLDMSECSTVQQYIQDMNDIGANYTFIESKESPITMLQAECKDFKEQSEDKVESIQFLDSSMPLL